MGTYVLGTVVKAVATTLSAAASLKRTQQYDEISEGMQDSPTLQVWPAGNTGTSWNSQTDRLTFRGPIGADPAAQHSVKEYTIHADVYCRQRAHINEDMAQVVTTVNEIEDILDDLAYPLFGLGSMYSFRWSWNYVTFDYGGVMYVGARFVITVRMGVTH